MEIQNKEELIKNLAHKGDPTAFFTLISPYLRKRYLKERLEGKEHREVVKKVIYEAVEYLSEVQEITTEKFNHWIEEKFSESSAEPTSSSNEEEFNIENEKKIKTEVDAFLSRCHRELIRASAVIKRNRLAQRRRFPDVLYYNRILRTILIVFSFVIIAIVGTFIMYWQRVNIKISITKGNEEFSFAILPFYNSLPQVKENKKDSLKSFDTLQDSAQIVKNSNSGEKLTESKIIKKDSSSLTTIRKTTSSPTSQSLPSNVSSTSTPSPTPSQKKILSSPEQSGVTTSSSRSLEPSFDTASRRISPPPSPSTTIPSSPSATGIQTEQSSTPPSSLQQGN